MTAAARDKIVERWSPPKAEAVVDQPVAEKRLSQFELEAAQDQRERLLMQLDNARPALQKRVDELAEVVRREDGAARFLKMATGTQGFETQKTRAHELLEHCARRRRELEPLVENQRRRVTELQQQLRGIPAAALDRQNELAELGRSLSSPLP